MILAFILLLLSSNTKASNIVVTNSAPTVDYPVRFGYINTLRDWSSPQGIARSMGVPGYAPAHKYNYICLTFWTYGGGPLDIAKMWNNPTTYIGKSTFGATDVEIRTNLKKIYNDNGIKLMVSAFGATEQPTSAGYDATDCAKKLADYVSKNDLDGVDIDWEDTAAFQRGTGEDWLITFTTVLRSLLPNAIITHAPQAPYFVGTSHYPKNGYLKVNSAVGSMIQFYNVQFYNQDTSPYNTANTLFNASGGWAPGTSVNEIISKGVPSNKIVVGKPATTADAAPGSYMSASSISSALVANHKYNGWQAGVMFWQYSSDPNGVICSTAISALMNLIGNSTNKNATVTNSSNTNSSNTNATNTTKTNVTNSTNVTLTNSTTSNTSNTNNTTNTTRTNSTTNSTANITLTNTTLLNYPIRFAYIDKIADWSSANGIAKSMGIPGYAPNHIYNYLCLSIWTFRYGPSSAAMIWDNPIGYFGTKSKFGSTNVIIRSNIKKILS